MSDLETRLSRLRASADATVFADVRVSDELVERVLAAAAAEPLPAPAPRRRLSRPAVLRLAVATGVVAVAALVGVSLRPGAAATASLTVLPADRPVLVTVPDPRAAAAPIPLAASARTRVLPVEIDSFNSLAFRWSPDGRRLAFGNRGDLFVYDAERDVTTNVTRTPDRWEFLPAWSPDGTRLAFTSRPLGPGEGPPTPGAFDWTLNGVLGGAPTVVDADGSGYRVLAGVTIAAAPSWSPDGRTVAFAAGGTLRLADVEAGGVRTLSAAELGLEARLLVAPVWSPARDELAVFFAADDREPTREELLGGTAPAVRQGYALVDLSSLRATVVHEYEAPFAPRGPAAWSGDGERLALLFRQETAVAEPVELAVVDRAGRVVLRRPGLYSQVVWEPGRARLAVRSDDEPGVLLVVSFEGERPETETLRFAGELAGVAWKRD